MGGPFCSGCLENRRIEVSVRTQWTYYFAENHDSHAYMDCKLSNNIQWHAKNIIRLQEELERGEEP